MLVDRKFLLFPFYFRWSLQVLKAFLKNKPAPDGYQDNNDWGTSLGSLCD